VSADSYLRVLAALIPRGLPWPRDPRSVLQRLLGTWADELDRADERAADLLGESDPRGARETIGDWERAFGLPDTCSGATDGSSLSQRRQQLVARVTAPGGQSPAHFVALAASLGHTATVVEYRPHTVGDSVSAPLTDAAWASAWDLCVSDLEVFPLTVLDGLDQPLAQWDEDERLPCVIARLAPAHTLANVTYEV
jgi:uncharacterized protein YmfQ (DUF2313 family)